MNNTLIIQQILHQIKDAKQKSIASPKIYEDKDHHDLQHEFLFFIKPEIIQVEDDDKLKAIFELLLRKISQFGFIIREIRLLGASYLEKYDIIAQHYGVINALSRDPLKVFTTEAKSKFRILHILFFISPPCGRDPRPRSIP